MDSHIFLGFVFDKKKALDDAETMYLAATTIKPGDLQGWQGLVSLYRRQGAKKMKQYQRAAIKLAEIFWNAKDAYKCQDVVDKFIDYARTDGDRQQYAVVQGSSPCSAQMTFLFCFLYNLGEEEGVVFSGVVEVFFCGVEYLPGE